MLVNLFLEPPYEGIEPFYRYGKRGTRRQIDETYRWQLGLRPLSSCCTASELNERAMVEDECMLSDGLHETRVGPVGCRYVLCMVASAPFLAQDLLFHKCHAFTVLQCQEV
jgi:hypothetical protein